MSSSNPGSAARPNILWISLEDCSPRFGCYGDALARTPHVDRVAAEGCLWSQAFSTAPVCAPARCAIITGMYAASIGAQHMRTTQTNDAAPHAVPPYQCVPPPYVKLLPEYLRTAGYFCTNNQKTDYQFHPPFTAWDIQGKTGHWRERAEVQPFFAVFNFERSHESGMWPEKRPQVATDPARVTVPPYLPDTPETRLTLARHYDNLEEVDTRAGEILQQLREDGLDENTIVFIWSDHGEGIPRRKRWPYDSGLRVPLIVRWLGRVEPGSICHDVVSTIDLPATVLALAGVPLPRHLQGQPFLGPAAAAPRRYAFATRDRYDEFYDGMRSVRDERFRYVRNLYPELPRMQWNDYLYRHPIMQELWRGERAGTLTEEQQFLFASHRPPEELYDLRIDPDEVHNLADDPWHREPLHRLRAALDDWQREIGDLAAEPEEQMARRFWPDLRQPDTMTPVWIAIDETRDGQDPVLAESVELRAPCRLLLYNGTQGASIGYRFDTDPPDRWRLYQGPFALPPGTHRLEAKAIRIGYRESSVRCLEATVTAGA